MRTYQSLAYIAPSIVVAFLFGPLAILQGVYAKYFGIPLTTIATVLLISRLFDAITDPLIGYYSDQYYAISGSRKPFVIAGSLLFILSSYFLYVPIDPYNPDSESAIVSTHYFLCWFIMVYLAWTLVEIPHLAWGSDLAETAEEKNKIYSLRAVSFYLGTLLFYLVPFLPFLNSTSFTPQTLLWAAVSGGLLMIPALYMCIKLTPDGIPISKQRVKQDSILMLRKEIFANKPFLIYIIALTLYGVGTFEWFTLMFIFIDTYLALGAQFASLSLTGILFGLAMLGIWLWLANHLGKTSTCALGISLYITGVLGAGFLEPGKANLAGLVLVIVLVYVASASITALLPSMLSDIIDYSTWKFGRDRSATYFSIYTFFLKGSAAIGGFIAFGIAGWYDFDVGALVQTEDAVFGLRLATCWLPALLMLLSILVMMIAPINSRRHKIIRSRLNARVARMSTHSDKKLSDSPLPTLAQPLNDI